MIKKMTDPDISQINIHLFATSGKSQQYIAEFGDRRFEVGESVARLITVMQEADTLSEVAQKYKTTERTPYLINRAIIYSALYKKTDDAVCLHKAQRCLEKAALKNPHDVMIRYYQASVLREEGKPESALAILTELTRKFPHKNLCRLGVFDLLYQNGQQESAFPHLLQAVKTAPDLWDSTYLKGILAKDSTTRQSLKNGLLQDILSEKDSGDPVLLAKNGKLFLSLGLEEEAGQCLEKALSLLPNLIYPHYYLSQIERSKNNPEQSMIYGKQFVFLRTGTMSKKIIDRTVASGEIETHAKRKDIIDNSYTAKFKTWYHSLTYTAPFMQ
jgi:tetratricopeptide (TPR) repeat protein